MWRGSPEHGLWTEVKEGVEYREAGSRKRGRNVGKIWGYAGEEGNLEMGGASPWGC